MITQSRLKECLDYNEVSGLFTWKKLTSNRTKIGAVAGCSVTHNGYVAIGLNGHLFYAHRLAWLYVHGVLPPAQIDHINGIRSDNRIANLRLATPAENTYNKKRLNPASGLKGAYRDGGKRWRSQIVKNGKQLHLGCFATAEEAHAAYVKAATELHGQFARAV